MKDTASKKKKDNKKIYETFSESRKRKVATKVSESATINSKEPSLLKMVNPFPVLDKKSPDDYKHVPGLNAKKEAEKGYNPFGRYATYIPTQEIEGSFVRVDSYKEVTEGTTLEGLQKTVFMDRYSMRDDTGKQLEIYPEQLWRRVSRAIASVEKTDYLKKKWEDKFYGIMTDFKFVPAGRILSGAGTGALVTYYNCFVIPSPEDSRTGIIDNLKIMTEIMSRSGGVGINLSTLRPRGSYIKTVNGHSSGPMAWAQLYSVATGDVISQGGCFAPDERISTDKGLIRAQELVERIEAGEKFLAQTHEGLKPITFSFRNGKKEIFTIVTKRGYKVKVTGEHKMGVISNGKIKTVELNRLSVGDEALLLLGKEIKRSEVELPATLYRKPNMSTTLNEDVHLPNYLNPDLAFLLGFSYGDGYVIKGKKVNWKADKGISLCVSSDQVEVIERLKNIIKQQFNITAVVQNGDGKCINVKFYSRIVVEWLRENGLLKDKADKICVPEKVFASPSNVVSAFIAGYYEADGCDRGSKAGYGIDSISLEMLNGVQMLLLSNGIVSHISSQTREGWNRLYRLSITGAEFKSKFSEFVNTNKDARYEGHRSHNLSYPMEVWKELNIPPKYYKGVFDSTKSRVSHYALQRIEERLLQDEMLLEANKLNTFLNVMPDEIVAIVPSGISYVYDFEVDGVHMLSGAGLYTSNSRRGALMLMLDDNHPDIEEFITVKKTPGMITHANLSVCVSDAFMEAVRNDEDWDLVWKGEVMKTVKARHLWDMICTSAWESAEPGVVFTDRYNKMSNTWYYEDIRCTNPCGEQGLGEWQVCNLGSINLAAFVKEDGSFDYADLEYTTRTAMRFLDNVIDSCYYFFKENRDAQLSTRRTGLGTMGLADALIKMKLRYGSEEALKVVEKIYTLMRDAAYDESSDISLEKGSFPMFIKDKYLEGNFIKQLPENVKEKISKNGIRNAVLLSQAPTGTISLYAGVSSGIEPVFAFAMVRTDRTGTHTIYHPLFEEWKTSVPEGTEVPDYFVSSADLTPEDHVRIQAVIQKYTDSSISKTVNAPNGYSVENVKKLYRLAYDLGCKGITFYREGSRDAVLTTLDTKKTEEKVENSRVDLKQREELLTGVTYKTHTPVGTAYITINSDSEGNIFEIFINVGKAGSDIYADATALGRLISLMFQVPSSLPSNDLVDHVINRLEDIGGASSTGFGAKRVRSLADAVAKVLAQHVGSNAIKKDLKVEQVLEEQKHQEADFCPECGQATLVKEEGCQKCYNCGFSKC